MIDTRAIILAPSLDIYNSIKEMVSQVYSEVMSFEHPINTFGVTRQELLQHVTENYGVANSSFTSAAIIIAYSETIYSLMISRVVATGVMYNSPLTPR
ncbi:hypothetical protein AGENTSMITH_99 [Bacillus phage vB_BspM_AgentSmith]|nr:hypothetical protein AGENTSMITH_99 [Bacillus phage vB_BspM_AgentSmith]